MGVAAQTAVNPKIQILQRKTRYPTSVSSLHAISVKIVQQEFVQSCDCLEVHINAHPVVLGIYE